MCMHVHRHVVPYLSVGLQQESGQVMVPEPTLSPTHPVPRGLLTLCPAAQGQGY